MQNQIDRGTQVGFKMMFSGNIGQAISNRRDLLPLNMYACAGMESAHYHAARGDNGMSYGFFQMHTKVHKPQHIQDYIETGLRYLGISFSNDGIPPIGNVDWEHAVGLGNDNYHSPAFAPDVFVGMCVDPQLLCWLGYMIKERYVSSLCSTPVFMDIKRYQKAQRFHKDGMEIYELKTKEFFWKGVSQYKWRKI